MAVLTPDQILQKVRTDGRLPHPDKLLNKVGYERKIQLSTDDPNLTGPPLSGKEIAKRQFKQAEQMVTSEQPIQIQPLNLSKRISTPKTTQFDTTKLAADIARAPVRAATSFVLEALPTKTAPTFQPKSKAAKIVFGKEPIKPVSKQIDVGIETGQRIAAEPMPGQTRAEKGFLKGAGGIIGGTAAGLLVVGDLVPWSPGKKQAAKIIANIADEADMLRFLVRQGVAEDIARIYAPKLAKEVNTVADAEKAIMSIEKLQASTQGARATGGLSNLSTTGVSDKILSLAKAKYTPYQKQVVTLGTVEPKVLSFAKENVGLDLTGYSHEIDNFALRHSKITHPNLTDSDFTKIPEIIHAPDKLTYAGKNKQGLDSFMYEKKYNGMTYYVEEVRTGNKTLSMKTLKKTKTLLGASPAQNELGALRPSDFQQTPTPQSVSKASLADSTKTVKSTKERGFITSVKESPQVAPQVKKQVSGRYTPITNKETMARAQELVERSPEEALLKLNESKDLDADYTATAIAYMNRAQAKGDYQGAVRVAETAAEKLTQGGQFIQTASMLNRLTPEGILVYASRQLGKGKRLSPQLAKELTDQVKKIQAISDDLPYVKFQATQDLMGKIERNVPKSLGNRLSNWAFEFWTLPKTIASSMDISASLRQGLFPASSFPKEWGAAFKAQFKAGASEKGYASLMNDVMLNRHFGLANDAGVSFADITGKLSAREDRFISTWASKIPGVSHSNRAYTGFLNKLRMDMFSRMVDDAQRLGVMDDKWLKDAARFINDATGRGDWKAFRGSANKLLQGVMFSPRLMYSRLNLLTSPVSYLNASPHVRKQLWKSLFTFGASTASILGLASLIPGVEVGKDPRSADFGKIKIGNARFDIAGGFQQYIRIAAQVASGKYISTTTGKVITLGEGYKPLTTKDILLRGLESKESPMAAFLSTILTGKNFEGEDVTRLPAAAKEFGKKFIPMALNDLWEMYKEEPQLLPFGFLGLFGVGVQAYPQTEAIVKMKEINVSPDPVAAFEKLKEENPILAEKVKDAKIQEKFTEFDWSLTYMGVENGERAKFLVERFNRLSSQEEKAALYEDLREKRLISERVADQIEFLLENPDYEIPAEKK